MQTTWTVPTLYFHHVSEHIVHYTSIQPKMFEKYIAFLAKHFSFWTASEAFTAFNSRIPSTGKLVLTFDDAYDNTFQNAIPILANYGIRASFFVLPEFVGKLNSWDIKRTSNANHMTWEQIANLAALGHDVGSHGMTHRSLIDLQEIEIRDELEDSKEILERNLGQRVGGFCYPYGFVNQTVERLAGQIYDFAFSTVKSEKQDWNTARFSLRRQFLPVTATSNDLCKILGLPTE